MARHAKRMRRAIQLLLALTAIVGFTVAAQANEIHSSYSLANGATSAPILIPAQNTPVSVTCTLNSLGKRGVGQATMLRVNGFGLEWVGTDLATKITVAGDSTTTGTHIIWCSFLDNQVDIQVHDSTSIQVHNASGSQATGVLTLIW
jgi:hypothetical protein